MRPGLTLYDPCNRALGYGKLSREHPLRYCGRSITITKVRYLLSSQLEVGMRPTWSVDFFGSSAVEHDASPPCFDPFLSRLIVPLYEVISIVCGFFIQITDFILHSNPQSGD